MATGREAHEQGEQSHYDEILGLPIDADAEGYYPSEKRWLAEHPEFDKPAIELETDGAPF